MVTVTVKKREKNRSYMFIRISKKLTFVTQWHELATISAGYRDEKVTFYSPFAHLLTTKSHP